MGIWNQLSAAQQAVGNIGCESCHGPGADHKGDVTKISKSLDAGVCNQCHDSPTHHNIGGNFNASNHATLKVSSAEASNNGCWPCHNGSAFAVDSWRHNWGVKPSKADTLAVDPTFKSISCASCHNPHSTANPNQLRYVSVDSLYNGYKITTGGKGQLCMNCHRARSSVAKSVTTKAPKYGWAGRFGGHHSVQADLLYGQNGYNYSGADTVVGSPSVHSLVTSDACVTCHMQSRNGQPNHEFSMDSAGVKDFAGVCTQCHSGVTTSFDQKMANADYDGNGKIEPFVTEVAGLMTQLKAKLPQDSFGNVISSAGDSMKIYNRPDLVQGIYNYNFILEDRSNGIHNPTYTIALLKASIHAIVTGVVKVDANIPGAFALGQNYPNPFNPTTKISFSLPQRANVRLEVYDMLGKQVATLLNESREAGNWNVDWNGLDKNGRHISSGVYFYRLEAGSFSSVKKMVMLK
jgi:predicted CXXCH cytochrome family protein